MTTPIECKFEHYTSYMCMYVSIYSPMAKLKLKHMSRCYYHSQCDSKVYMHVHIVQ